MRPGLNLSLKSLAACALLACVAAPAAPTAPAAPAYSVSERQTLSGPVRWDYLSTDSSHHRLFLTRGDHVDVYDTESKSIIGSVAGTEGVHGVAPAPDRDRGYTSNGSSDSVTVFSLFTLEPVARVKVGSKPDAIVYDAKSGRVFVANAKDGSLSVIDAESNKMIHTIALGGAPETAVVDGQGKLFVALEDKNAIAVIDTASMNVLARYDVASVCDEPAGLALDVATMRLFAGCHNGKMAIVDAVSGKLLASPPIGRGNDATAVDSARKLAFASNGDGSLTVIDANAPFKVLQTLETMPGARTMALDPATHALFLVSAERTAPATPAVPRPPMKPGTFTLLTIRPQ